MLEKRVFNINGKFPNKSKKYILYCMESSQRIDYNYALLYSIELADKYIKPLVVIFNITDRYKHSNQRYYRFMIEGILKLRGLFKDLGIKFVINRGTFLEGCLKFSKDAVTVVTETNYLKTQKRWREEAAKLVDVSFFEVESEVVVPVRLVSNKQEPYAMTIRPKIFSLLESFLEDVEIRQPRVKADSLDFESWELDSPDDYLNSLNIDKSVPTVDGFNGGTYEAERRLIEFIEKKLHRYKELRSDPTVDYQSNLSPYLHFGQISPVEIVKTILNNYPLEDENVKSFFNELIVWRELARNFCFYNPLYNQYEGIPYWAKQTLEDHKKDPRERIYSLEELESGKTHDPYWNAAQRELLKSGKMHNYMRMYWAKKLLELTPDPKTAFDIACYMNDKYEIDGRDPNGYAGISWCFGTHDRPWKERKIFGKIRYMSESGLKKKFNINLYLLKWLKD
ncbi:MAG: deoxyribodipyrimidine photo-lyase [Hydrogenothermaceae bacterium]|nr:deoxyribodipyrimidine photo-lyase [Hydrogenothermaceae bacterium]